MAKLQRRVATKQSNIGKSPTPSQKLIYVADKIGLTEIKKMQGTTFNLFDTLVLNTSAIRQTLSFFSGAQGKSRNFSNFQTGTLKAGETLIMERISLFLVGLTNEDLTSPTNAIGDMIPLSQVTVALVPNPGALKLGMLNISIANQTVVKDYNMFEQQPEYNPQTTGISIGNFAAGSGDPAVVPVNKTAGYNSIVLESPPVLPPNQTLEITIELPPVGTIPDNVGIMCVIGRFGTIYASKTTL